LRYSVWTVEQEDSDLLIRLASDVHCTMNSLGWIFPLDLTRRDFDALALPSITVLNREEIAAQDHRNAVKWIAMPRIASPGARRRRRTIVVPW
jgi:hypothetical protein